MYKALKFRLLNQIKTELDYVDKFETDKPTKFDKMLQLKNMKQLIENYEELEPEIAAAMNRLAYKKKFEQEER